MLSLTGAAASYGESQQKGLELAAEELAEKEGVTYELTIEDDQTDPRQGITLFDEFVAADVSLIIGPTLSNAALQADPIAQEAGVPVLGISNTAAGVTEIGDYIHRNSLTEQAVIPQTIAKATEQYGLEKVVVMYSNDDAFTESGFEAFSGALEDEGVEVAEEITFSKADTDFRALLTQAKESEPDALVVSALIEAAIPLVTQARELGIDVPIIGGNGFNNPRLMADAGDAAEGVVVGAAWNSSSDNPENAAFLEAFEAKYDAAARPVRRAGLRRPEARRRGRAQPAAPPTARPSRRAWAGWRTSRPSSASSPSTRTATPSTRPSCRSSRTASSPSWSDAACLPGRGTGRAGCSRARPGHPVLPTGSPGRAPRVEVRPHDQLGPLCSSCSTASSSVRSMRCSRSGSRSSSASWTG